MRPGAGSGGRRIAAVCGLALAAACAIGQPQVVTVGQLLRDAGQLASQKVVIAGRAGTVRFRQPERGSSGITFRLSDGTGSVQVVHDGTLNLREGELLQVRGELHQPAGGEPYLQAERIWIIGSGAAPP